MANTGKPRSIRFPTDLWEAIDEDAKKCNRSSLKQMETILSAYYGLRYAEVDLETLRIIREEQQPRRLKESDIMQKKKGAIPNKK